MPRPLRRLALLGGALLSTTTAAPKTISCAITVLPDDVRGAQYHALLTLSPECPTGGVARVRKSSTLNTRRGGAPYQPIKPLTGAWEMMQGKTTVPRSELWTLLSWEWQYHDPNAWNPRTREYGVWRRAGAP